MIGDKEQKFPGIAPRAFEAIYQLIEENKYDIICDFFVQSAQLLL